MLSSLCRFNVVATLGTGGDGRAQRRRHDVIPLVLHLSGGQLWRPDGSVFSGKRKHARGWGLGGGAGSA